MQTFTVTAYRFLELSSQAKQHALAASLADVAHPLPEYLVAEERFLDEQFQNLDAHGLVNAVIQKDVLDEDDCTSFLFTLTDFSLDLRKMLPRRASESQFPQLFRHFGSQPGPVIVNFYTDGGGLVDELNSELFERVSEVEYQRATQLCQLYINRLSESLAATTAKHVLALLPDAYEASGRLFTEDGRPLDPSLLGRPKPKGLALKKVRSVANS